VKSGRRKSTLRATEVETDVLRIIGEVKDAGGTIADAVQACTVIVLRTRSDDRMKVARMFIRAFSPSKELARAIRFSIDPEGVRREFKSAEREKRKRERRRLAKSSRRRRTPRELGPRGHCRYGSGAYVCTGETTRTKPDPTT
jgi:hypothetical protein